MSLQMTTTREPHKEFPVCHMLTEYLQQTTVIQNNGTLPDATQLEAAVDKVFKVDVRTVW